MICAAAKYFHTSDETIMSEPSPKQNDYNNDGQGPMATLSSDTGKEVTLASSEDSASSVSAGLYFFIVWLVLLILIITLLCITIDCRCKRKVNQQRQHEQQLSHDTEAGEQQTSTMQTETRSNKFNNGIGITVLFLGSLIGLGLSVFSIITCEFVTLDSPLTMDTFYNNPNDRFSITVYSLGLWNVDVTSNISLSGCVDTSFLFFQEDALYKFAKVSNVLASVIGGISPLIFMCLLIIPSSSAGKKVRYLVWPFMLAAFFQLMTLTLFGSYYCKNDGNNNCQFSLGAIASITSALYWILEVFASAFINFIDPTVDPSYSI